jgi:hypothetical protein
MQPAGSTSSKRDPTPVALFRRRTTSKSPEVRWLASTQIRQRPRRRLRGLVVALVLAEIVFVAVVFLAQRRGADPPRGQIAVAPKTDAPAAVPDLRGTIPPAQPAAPDRPSEPAVSVVPDAQTDTDQPPDPPPAASPVTGAFPAPSSDGDDPTAANFAVYLNEFAPDQAGALALAIGAQRRFGAALGGARFSYKRVRAADNDVFRLRVSGFSRERASQICEAVTEMGGACEVGPK